MKRWKFVALALMVVIGLFAWFMPSAVIRYRLTVTFNVDGREVSGSSVQQFQVMRHPAILPHESLATTRIRGQAAMIDLGQRGKVFSIVSQGGMEAIVRDVFKIELTADRSADIRKLWWTSGGGEAPAKWLRLVRFRDINDPASVEAVDTSDPAKTLGPGVSLTSVKVEAVNNGLPGFNLFGLTGTPMTTGIENHLPWLDRIGPRKLDGERFQSSDAANSVANSFGAANFRQGM
jgi:hypothetical protein